MTFNPFSLDYIYYPVSGIMWVWHKVFGSFMGASNVWAWVLSIVFLVFTLRAIMFKPFMKQMDSQLKMQAVQPEMKKLREKYKDDRQRLAEEMMKLNKESGVSPLGGCLPMLVQAPVFIGLFHVLRMFQPVLVDGQWTFRQNVYFFGANDVQSFSQAAFGGHAPLGGSMTMPIDQLSAFPGAERGWIIAIGIPLTILAGIATHLTSRRSVARQAELNAGSPLPSGQAAIMNKLMLWVFPLFVIAGGPFFPLAILFYWLSNNSWTFGQLWAAHRIQDKRKATEQAVVEEAKQEIRFTKPKPGARPIDPKRPVVQPSSVDRDAAADGPVGSDGPSLTKGDPSAGGSGGNGGTAANGSANGTAGSGAKGAGAKAGAGSSAARKPPPGARSGQSRPGGSKSKKRKR